jgi:hypothetical protein
MPINFNFRNRETNELVVLQRIDDQICAFMGKEPDPVKWSPEYDAIVYTLGLNAARMFQTDHFTAEQVTAAVVDHLEYNKDRFTQEDIDEWNEAIPCFIEFMCIRYDFRIWRGC